MRRLLAVLAVLCLVTGAAVASAQLAPDAPRDYDLSGQPDTGVRPTAVGLPRVFPGGGGTVGASELVPGLMSYHDSGRYEQDLEAVGGQALDYLKQRLAAKQPADVCKNKYVKTKRKDSRKRTLYYRKKSCKAQPFTPLTKPAIVLDIDETSLSNYSQLATVAFSATGVAVGSIAGNTPAIKPTLALFNYAKANGVAVFFVTGRPASLNGMTEANLKSAGYANWDGLMNKTSDKGTLAFKAGARKEIEGKGYTIVVNMGDQESDLAGGYAERAFKLPNPFYFIPE